MVSTLRKLLTDHFSRVRYRAVQAIDNCPELIGSLQAELRKLDRLPESFLLPLAGACPG
jgi:hypothetical protein